MQIRRVPFTISMVLVAISLLSIIIHGGPRYSIDFKGGSLIELKFEDKSDSLAAISVPIDDIRDVFNSQNIEAADIRYYGSNQDIAAQVDNTLTADTEKMTELYSALRAKFPDYKLIERRVETVGPKIGGELVMSAIWAILVSMVLILIYIMFRFELRFGIGAVIALFHDVIITIGLFSLLDIEISIPVIAAVLTIIGYSLNDTIVVFDRIRENMKSFSRQVKNYAELVNRSINETLSRTIVTSGTTLIVVIILYFFGGEIIKDFALALIIGVVIGTYSSIFVASPILVEWQERSVVAAPAKK
ncbi:MAG TPA: protein translocase subunit SecF [Calditrichia bacterium]|nr:protein translocase subunit SecF [Calditrichia bacterium]